MCFQKQRWILYYDDHGDMSRLVFRFNSIPRFYVRNATNSTISRLLAWVSATDYTDIQSYRNNSAVSLHICVYPDIKNAWIIKLLLQLAYETSCYRYEVTIIGFHVYIHVCLFFCHGAEWNDFSRDVSMVKFLFEKNKNIVKRCFDIYE